MAASPTTTAEQTLILNTVFDVSGESGPLLDSLDTFDSASPWRRVSGDTAPLRVILVDDGGSVPGTPRRVILASGNTLSLTAKVEASDVDMALSLTFTQVGSEGAEYYEADPGTLAVSDAIFNGNPEANLKVDFQEKTSGGTILRQWRASLILLWSTASGGTTSPLYYVGYNAQSPTNTQKTQALNNLGASASGKTVLQGTPAEARAALEITGSGDIVSDGTITSANAGKVAVVGSTTKQIGAGVGYGSNQAGTLVIQDSTILTANAGRLVMVSGDSNGMIEVGPAYASAATASTLVLRDASGGITVTALDANGVGLTDGTVTAETGAFSGIVGADGGFTGGLTTPFTISDTGVATVRATAFFQGAVWFGMGAALSGQGSYVSENGAFLYGEGGTLTGSFSSEGGSISAASGAFSVSATGDMTATHGKFQGSAGGAGHTVLSYGTTPNGTGSTLTLWGISGGSLGWRDGTGTAYSMKLVDGTPATTSDLTDAMMAMTWHQWDCSTFAQAVSGSGATSSVAEMGMAVAGPTTVVGYGLRRSGGTAVPAISRGKGVGVIAWSRVVKMGAVLAWNNTDSNATVRMTFGKNSTDNAGNFASGRRGIGVQRVGSGALEIITGNGTAVTTSTNSTFTPTNSQAIDILVSSDGAGNVTLYVNDSLVASCTGGPTTDSANNEHALQFEVENTGTTASAVTAYAGNFKTYLARS